MANRWAALALGLLLVAAVGWFMLREQPRPAQAELHAIDADVAVERELGDQTVWVLADEQAGPRDVVLFMHGYGGDHTAVATDNKYRFTQGLVDAGVVVASADAGGNAWGSEASQQAYLELYDYVQRRFDVEDVVIVGESMGAIAGLNIAAGRDIEELVGWVGISPVVDLQAASEEGPLVAAIRRDVPPGRLASVDPGRLASLPVPVRVTVTEADSVVPALTGVTFAERVGGEVTACQGGHASVDCHRVQLVVDLLER